MHTSDHLEEQFTGPSCDLDSNYVLSPSARAGSTDFEASPGDLERAPFLVASRVELN